MDSFAFATSFYDVGDVTHRPMEEKESLASEIPIASQKCGVQNEEGDPPILF